ncbi:MAG: hypothetical protein IJV26_11865, partial [Lachnospiraceae bacterium]|nr:hypothetical protein [Lachnospiraceae bacterium]
MHKRKHRMLGRFLSIALAAVLTVTSCYVAPARALADDGSAGGEAAVTETVTPQPEAPAAQEPAAEEPTAEQTAEQPAAQTDAGTSVEAGGAESEGTISDGQAGSETAASTATDPNADPTAVDPNAAPAAEGIEDAESAEGSENAEGTDAEDAEKKPAEEIEVGDETSEFISTVALIYQYGQETETSTVTLKGNASVNLSGQAKSIEGYELESITVQNGTISAAADSILQKVEGESASLFYIESGSGTETSIDGSVSVVFVYKEAVSEEEEPEEKETEVIDKTIKVYTNGSQVEIGEEPKDIRAIGEEAAEEGQILTSASYHDQNGNEVELHYVKNVTEENVKKTVFTNDEDAANGSYQAFDLAEDADTVEITFSYETEEKEEKEPEDRTLTVYANGEQIEIGSEPVDIAALGEAAAEEDQTFLHASYTDQNGSEIALHFIKNTVKDNVKQTVFTNDEDAASENWQTFDLAEGAESVEITFHYEAEEKIVYKSGFLRYKNGDYSITIIYSAEAEIPEGAYLDVREIEKDTEEYQDYLNAAVEKLGNSDESVTARFFDIKIKDESGSEIEPVTSVNVRISYRTPANVSSSSSADVVHISDDNHTSTVNVNHSSGNMVSFGADSFSVYGIVYTVDFEYNGYAFSMPGGTMLRLTDILSRLGVNVTNEQIIDAEFTDYGLAAVYQASQTMVIKEIAPLQNETDSRMFAVVDGIGPAIEDVYTSDIVSIGTWVFDSYAPFSSEEVLSIYTDNNQAYLISVTDVQNEDGTWNLEDNTSSFTVSTKSKTDDIDWDASIDLDFSYTISQSALQEMKDAARAGTDPVIVYDFNSALTDGGVILGFANEVRNGMLMAGGRRVGNYSIVDGVLTITITSRSWLIGRTSLPGTFGLSVSMNEEDNTGREGDTFEFPGAGNIDVTYKKRFNIQEKTVNGTKNSDGSWTLSYSAQIVVNRELSDLDFSDTYAGLQTLNEGSVKINGHQANIEARTSSGGGRFDISSSNFKSALGLGADDNIPAGTYNITYTTTVAAEDLIKEEIGEETGTTETNSATWKVDGGDNLPGGETEKEIPYEEPTPPTPPFKKSSDPASGTQISNAGQEITYTIEVGDADFSLEGLHVTDSMTDLQTLVDGKVYIAYGSPDAERTEMSSDSIKWVNDDNYSTNSLQVFDYTFGSGSGNGPAYIIYTTRVIDQTTATENGIYGTVSAD